MLKKEADGAICSRRGCNNDATWKIVWKNPVVRGDREKIWMSCEDHVTYFRHYFSYRSFPVEFLQWTPDK